MPHQTDAPVISNFEIVRDHYVITCRAPEIAAEARPGHFVNARIAEEGYDPLLRKPFSIYTVERERGEISLLYSVVGATTRGMARKQPGHTLDIVGPLGGKLFTPATDPDTLHIMVGGGYGVPPLVFLSRELLRSRKDTRLAFLIGARTKDLLLCETELKTAGITTHTATDDGSCGFRGRVTDALAPLIAEHKASPISVYCCGPTPMMRAVGALCAEAGVPCQVSVEVSMPCGVGVCMGCVLDLTDGKRVRCCVDGPVFEAQEVSW
jgi:dihydroorotate dehydrogenase electron transfer subunit